MSDRRDYDADAAARSLGMRLTDWGVTDAGSKARSFIDEMQRQGWRCRVEATPVIPPRRVDECPRHPGQYRGSCSACVVDRYGDRDGDDGQPLPATVDDAKALARAGVHAAQEKRRQDDAAWVAKKAGVES